LPANKRHNPLEAYEQLVFSDNPTNSIPAAIRWNTFESNIMSLLPRPAAPNSEVDGEVELARARVQIHYIQNHCFVGDRDLLAESKVKLAHIPTDIIQGRYDMVCPPITAWELSRAMPHASFDIIEDAGHSAMEAGITSALVAATEKFKSLNI
jgi:proline iminopeptidase